jgi:hypothetical protein
LRENFTLADAGGRIMRVRDLLEGHRFKQAWRVDLYQCAVS